MEVFVFLNDGSRDRRKSEFEETTRNVSFGFVVWMGVQEGLRDFGGLVHSNLFLKG